MVSTNEVCIYTDGACRGNQSGKPNIGAWAYILIWGDRKKADAQAVTNTTNNQMEVQAAVEALKALKPAARSMPITLFSDSQYLVKGYNKWLPGWRGKDFRGVKNPEFWRELSSLGAKFPQLHFVYVPGHSKVEYNEDADYLCNAAMNHYIEEHRGALNDPRSIKK